MSRPDEVVEILRARILDLSYPADAPLREETLAREFSVSRRTIREAVMALEASGLAVRERNRGGRVRRFGPADIADLYQARRAWETFGASHAGDAESGEIAAVQRAYADLEHVARSRPDSLDHARADMGFHASVAALARSPRLDRIFTAVREEMIFAIRILQREEAASSRDVEEDLAQHRRIADAVARHDAAEAVAAVEEHIRVNRMRLVQLADQANAPAS